MSHICFPIIGTLFYIFYPKTLIFSETFIKRFSIIHNTILTLFSGYICYNVGSIVISNPFIIAQNYYLNIPRMDILIFWFYLSKYYEYFDTFILYAKGRKPISLQTFHHIGAVWAWYFSYYYKVDAVIWATLFNSFVHTIMYSYYLLTSFKINLGFVKRNITTLQVVQLVSGTIFSTIAYYPPVETPFNYAIICGSNVYVCVVILLFFKFMIQNYWRKNPILFKTI
jgi:hypothetical protein